MSFFIWEPAINREAEKKVITSAIRKIFVFILNYPPNIRFLANFIVGCLNIICHVLFLSIFCLKIFNSLCGLIFETINRPGYTLGRDAGSDGRIAMNLTMNSRQNQ